MTDLTIKMSLAWIPQRYLVAVVGFMALTVSYMMRFCITIALPEMIAPKTKILDTTCNFTSSDSSDSVNRTYDFEWTSLEVSILQASFFVGYATSMIPAGILADEMGPKVLSVFSLVVTGVATITHPVFASYFGVWGMIIPRLIVGLAQGIGYAALHTLVAIWIPKEERSTWGTVVFSGVYIGNALNFGTSGIILGSVENGWPLIFYFYGSLGLLMGLIFFFLTYNRPEDHPRLSEKEQRILSEYSNSIRKKALPKSGTPWRLILTNNAVWSIIIGMFGHAWGLFLVITSMPMFMKAVLNYNIQSNGLFNAVTNIAVWVIGIMSGFICDYVSRKRLVSLSWNRKLGTTIASVVPSLGILIGGYTNCNRVLAVISLTVGIAFMGFFYPSLKVNPIDIAPNFAGTLGAMAHFCGAIAGFLVSLTTAQMTPDNSLVQWRYVFWLGFVIMSLTNIYYVALASAEVQKFNDCNAQPSSLSVKKSEAETAPSQSKSLDRVSTRIDESTPQIISTPVPSQTE